MYYAWNWWWWFVWFIPMAVLLWIAFGAYGRRDSRYYRPRGYYRDPLRYGPYADDSSDSDYYGIAQRRRKNRGLGPRNYQRSDARILEDVNDRMLVSDDLDASAVDVRVESGKVCLTGNVTSRFEKRLAEAIADSVAGVRDVDNQLRIGTTESVSHTSVPANATSS